MCFWKVNLYGCSMHKYVKNLSFEWKVSNSKFSETHMLPYFQPLRYFLKMPNPLMFLTSLGKYFLRWFFFFPCCGLRKSVTLFSCEGPKTVLIAQKIFWEESNLKKSEAEVNLFPGNVILLQVYPVTVDPI